MIIEVILYKVAKKADLISMFWEMLERSIIYLSLEYVNTQCIMDKQIALAIYM